MAKDGRGGGDGSGGVCFGLVVCPKLWEPACASALQGIGNVTGFGRAALGMLTARVNDGSGSLWINATSYFAG